MKTRSPAEFAEAFWSKTRHDGSDCLLWTGATTVQYGIWGGYGKVRWQGKYYLAHRMAYQLFTGTAPDKDMFIMHTCDTPRCVNPDHLRLGTPKENDDDKMAKGRQGAYRKLTADQVEAIRQRLSSGESSYSISEDYPVTARTIRWINSGVTWKRHHLTE